ncbi:MAG TPA: hypothetical protein PKN62_00480 [bacterium]|nr:hypothetical protein [bacterium]
MSIFDFFKKKQPTPGQEFVEAKLAEDQKNNQEENVNKIENTTAAANGTEAVVDTIVEVEPELESENNVEEIAEGPDRKAEAKIIGGVAYKSLTSILGIKTITDSVGAIAGLFGWKTGQQTDIYKYGEQNKQASADRRDLALEYKIEDIVSGSAFYKDRRDEFLQSSGFDNDSYKLKMKDLIGRYKNENTKEESEKDENILEEIKKEIASLRQEKECLLNRFRMIDNSSETISRLAREYNNTLKQARSSEYYGLDKTNRAEVDQKLNDIFGKENLTPEEEAIKNKYLPEESMKKRLGQVIANFNDQEKDFGRKDEKEIDKIIKDYIHGKVAFSSLAKDALNTAFVLGGGVAAGAFRGIAYGGLALAERYQKNEQEYRKNYSWNEVGKKIGFGSKMHDLFIGSVKETFAGLRGKEYQSEYSLDNAGKLTRQEDLKNIDNGLQKFGARAKAIGELARVFGIGTQAITAGITDGLNFEHAANGFAKTFTDGNVLVNVGENWYDNARIDQRIAKSFGKLFGEETAVFGASGNPESPDSEIVSSSIDNTKPLDGDQKMINDLVDSKIVVSKGGSISQSLGHPVDSSRGITLISRSHDGIVVYKDYNPDNIQPGVRLIEKDGEIIALDENPENIDYYNEHSGVEELKPIESSDHKKIIAEAMRQREVAQASTEEAVTINKEPAKPSIPEKEIEAMNPEISKAVAEAPLNNLSKESLANWKLEDYKEAIYGPLAVKDTTYQDLAEAAGKNDQEFFDKFILSDRQGGIMSSSFEANDYQDLDSDIDRIYHSEQLDNNQKVEILEKIREELGSSKLTDHIDNESLKLGVQSKYDLLKEAVDDDIEIIKKSHGGNIIPESITESGVQESEVNPASSIDIANSAMDDMDSNEKAFEVLIDPKSNFSEIKNSLLQAVPDHGKTDIGGITFRRIGDNVYDESGNLLTDSNYQQLILKQANALNKLTASDEFKEILDKSQPIKGALSNDLMKESFAGMEGSIKVYDKFIDPSVNFEEKIAGLKSVLDNKQSMKIDDLTFARLNDKIYLVTDSKKVIELKDKTVVNDILEARQAAMKAALARIQTAAN